MTSRTLNHLVVVAAMATLIALTGCERDTNALGLAPFPTDPEVFLDGFGPGVDYGAFGDSKVDALSIDANEFRSGSRSLRITVPSEGDPTGPYAGGAFFSSGGRDLSGYNALTFWAKGSRSATFNEVGFGLDFARDRFVAKQENFLLSTSWRKYVVPIPDPSRLTVEKGLFYFAEGPENGVGMDIWVDEVQFEKLGTIAQPRPAMLLGQDQVTSAVAGGFLQIGGTVVTYNVNGADQTVSAAPAYFDFISSDNSVATVDSTGGVTAVDTGTVVITARMGSLAAAGSLTINVGEAPPGPQEAAPTPTRDAGNVISLFSNAYTNVPVDTWSADFDQADLADIQINGDDVKQYSNLAFAAVEFVSNQIDATSMTNFTMDFWTPDPTATPAVFIVKLVDFGADGAFGGGDDSEHSVTLSANSTPAIASGAWVTLDIPLANFAGLTSRSNLAQLIIEGTPNTVYLDNIYFHNEGGGGGGGNEPTQPAPTPTLPAGDVVSLFSDAYTDAMVDTWSADWDNADVADVQIAGDNAKLYTNAVFAGVEFTTQTVDASAMERFTVDLWTPNPTALPAVFRIKLVDFGPDGMFDGGDDTEHELTLDANTTPGLASETWVKLDIPLADFTGLTTTGHLAQLIFSGDLGTFYIDNVYFYTGGGGGGSEPTVAAPTPTEPASEVTSLFSNAYTDVMVDTWSAVWDDAEVADVQVAGDDTKLYTDLVFAGIEFTTQTVDASNHTHFSMDIWTPDATAPPATFRIKLVDFGPDGMFDGGDDSEHEITLDANTVPGLATGSWVEINIPLADFTGLVETGHLAQLILSSDPNTVYVDNVYFYGGGGGGGDNVPTQAAPTPTEPASEVTSLFSNAYTDVMVDTWSAVWDDADVADTLIAGDDAKVYSNMVFAGVEFTTQTVDASSHTHFSMDIWTPDATAPPATFRIKLVDFGPDGMFDGGDDSEHEITLDANTVPGLATGSWVEINLPLADFTGLAATEHLAQLILSSDPNTVYVDNVYFYGDNSGGGGSEPTVAAPTPTYGAGDVISMFSNAYTDVMVDTWSAVWDNADVADVQVAGDDTKLYTNLVFAGIEATTQPIDATAMTHFTMDFWTPDPTAAAVFRIKLVDFGADGMFDGGDDVEHEITLDATTTPGLVTGAWVQLDIPLSDFTGLTTTEHIAQLIISGDPNTVYVDNVLFHR